MRFLFRHPVTLAACATPAALWVLAYTPTVIAFGLAASAAAGWCFWLEQHPRA